MSVSGGTETTVAGWRVHTFTASGSLVVTATIEVDILVVAGGGGGTQRTAFTGGGAGAGGLLRETHTLTPDTYAIGVGANGIAGAFPSVGTDGGDSFFGSIMYCSGGGHGGIVAGGDGGSGGGNGNGVPSTTTAGNSVTGQGTDGGTSAPAGFNRRGGGGGGANSIGLAGQNGIPGHGGDPYTTSDFTGVPTDYAGGGASGSQTVEIVGQGGGTSGGDGAHGSTPAGDGVLGGGGGGGYDGIGAAGNGGHGIVCVRWRIVRPGIGWRYGLHMGDHSGFSIS